MSAPLPFVDLTPGDDGTAVHAAIARVLASGWFVLGPEVDAFETEFAHASGARHAVGVGTGTDAIVLLLRAAGIGPGDEVVVPAMTAAYTALAVTMVGARPVFADVEDGRLTMSAPAVEAVLTPRTRALLPVHLYGQAADVDGLHAIARRRNLAFIEDCCQAHLGTVQGQPLGTRGIGGAFSFYPTKNLGALGDGGAVITNDPGVAEHVRRLRNGGQTDRYHHVESGINSRLDEIQAAILRVRLPLLAGATARRRELAAAYRRLLPGDVRPVQELDAGHVYHLFPVRTDSRPALQAHLRAMGIDTLIHYPLSLPQQPAFAPSSTLSSSSSSPASGSRSGSAPESAAALACPVAARAAGELLSLPLHPRLSEADVTRVADAVASFWNKRVLA